MPAEPAIVFETLPAAYGDALLLSCPVPGGTWRLLVDAGPAETWPELRRRLLGLPAGADGTRAIDLAVVTHIDHDHIGAAAHWLDDRALALRFDDIWFNARGHLGGATGQRPRSVAEGESLAALLGARARPLPWNRAFGGAAACIPERPGFLALSAAPAYPRLTLLSPTPAGLQRLATQWDRERATARRAFPSEPAPEVAPASGVPGGFPDLRALAGRPAVADRSATNGASIALLLEHRGASLLLAADAAPAVLETSLRALARARRRPLPLRVDAFKLSHHGSRGNLSPGLLECVQAAQYVISTDNSRFGHPDDETLAYLVLHGGPRPVLCFNHATERNLRWADPGLQRTYGFAARYPQRPQDGAVLRLGGTD